MKQSAVQIPGDRTFVVYVEKEDGSYGPVETGSVMVKEYFDDFLTKRRHLEATLRADLLQGRISIIAYYATLLSMGEGDLAARIGVSRRRLRAHLTPGGFAKLRLETVRRYAEIFDIPVANLFQIIDEAGQDRLRQQPTGCPFVVVTSAAEERGGSHDANA
jgi:DNA-binding XRE family transcriptional regulator